MPPPSIQQVMNSHMPHSMAEERKPMSQPAMQANVQEQITPYLTTEEQLRRTMNRYEVVWQGKQLGPIISHLMMCSLQYP